MEESSESFTLLAWLLKNRITVQRSALSSLCQLHSPILTCAFLLVSPTFSGALHGRFYAFSRQIYPDLEWNILTTYCGWDLVCHLCVLCGLNPETGEEDVAKLGAAIDDRYYNNRSFVVSLNLYSTAYLRIWYLYILCIQTLLDNFLETNLRVVFLNFNLDVYTWPAPKSW